MPLTFSKSIKNRVIDKNIRRLPKRTGYKFSVWPLLDFFLCPKSRTGCSVKNTAFKAQDRERFSGLRALGFLQVQYAGPALASGTRRLRSKTGNVFWVGARLRLFAVTKSVVEKSSRHVWECQVKSSIRGKSTVTRDFA